jgi:hypothetical protein
MADQNTYRSLKQIPIPVGQSAKPLPNQSKIKIYEQCGTGRVVDDPRMQVEWKPIDQVAARVVAPAKWYNQSPPPPPKFEPRNVMPEKTEPITSPGSSRLKTKTVLNDQGFRETLIERQSVEGPAVENYNSEVKKGLKVTEDLTEKARELTATIDYLASEFRGPWDEFQGFIKAALGTVREQRIALGSETRLLMGSLKEVRQFFLEENYETEIRRLSEFIDLCERLQALKNSGFLDTVADTILALNNK